MRSCLLLLACACLMSAGVAAQQAGEDVLTSARVQMQARNLDSATALLRRITDSTSWIDTLRRVDALVLLGIVRYFQGADSASREAFVQALTLAPALPAPPMARLDSTLGALFDSARVATAGGTRLDTVYTCTPRCRGLDVEPAPVGGGQLVPVVVAEGRRSAAHGSAVLRAIVDTLGRVEPGSVVVVHSTLPPEIERNMVQGLLAARYNPGRVHGRAVRVLIELRIDINPH